MRCKTRGWVFRDNRLSNCGESSSLSSHLENEELPAAMTFSTIHGLWGQSADVGCQAAAASWPMGSWVVARGREAGERAGVRVVWDYKCDIKTEGWWEGGRWSLYMEYCVSTDRFNKVS